MRRPSSAASGYGTTPPSSPSAVARRLSSADRFISDRSLLDVEASHFSLISPPEPAEEPSTGSPSKQHYQKSMKANLFGSAGTILANRAAVSCVR